MALSKKGNNIVTEVKNDILTITVDLTKNLGVSKSGKNALIATSKGNQVIEGTDVTIGLNIYKPVE